jgi:signal transduction histidine kinase
MSEIVHFFSGLFAIDKWPARWHCGEWTSFHGWLYIISDISIWLAYFLIPYFIFNYLRQKREGLKYSNIYFLFASFILLCGTTHFFDALMFWIPMYRLNALIRFLTGAVSLLTVYYLVQLLPEFFKQKTYNELLTEIDRRKEAERKLAIANADLEKFAYVASHDLQEPLRKMIVFNQMLEQRNRNVFDDKSRELIQKSIRSSNRMQHLITDVLSLAKITQDITLQAVDLNQVVAQALEDLDSRIIEKQAIIKVDALPQVKGTNGYLLQLFDNLLINALKFTHKVPEIKITATTDENFAYIQVSDNGIGIDKEYFEKIFLPFQRLNGAAEFEGSGIGLSICYKITHSLGGSIDVESEPGKGTVFTLKLQKA